MISTNRNEAQKRADDIHTFTAELQQLENDGILELDAAQRQAVAAHHNDLLSQLARSFDIDRNTQAKQLSLGMRIVSFLGALALAISVFFLFYQFWGLFSPQVQVPILIVTAITTFLCAAWVKQHDSSGYFAKLAAIIAFACFVLNIAMLGQIFNITPSDKALLPWAAFALLLAYAYDLRLLLVAGLLCLIAFVAARVGTWGGVYWLSFGERPENFFPLAIGLFFVPKWIEQRRFSGFAQTYRTVALLAFFLPVLVLANWGASSYLNLDTKIVQGIYQTIGFVGTALVIRVGTRWEWPEVINTGTVLFVIFLYTKIFDWWWDLMPKYLFFFVIGLIALLLLFIFKRMRATGYSKNSGSQP